MLTLTGDFTPISSQICQAQDTIASHLKALQVVFFFLLTFTGCSENALILQGFVLVNLRLVTKQDTLIHAPSRKPPGWRLVGHWRSKGCCWDAECEFYPPPFGTWSDCSWSCGSPCSCLCRPPAHSSNQGEWQAAWIHWRKGWLAGLNCITSYNHIINMIYQSCKHNAHHKLILCEKRKVLLRWVMARSAA